MGLWHESLNPSYHSLTSAYPDSIITARIEGRERMNDCYSHYSKLPGGKVNIVIPSKFESLITGVSTITQDSSGKIEVIYTDGVRESVIGEEMNISDDTLSITDIVTKVQYNRL